MAATPSELLHKFGLKAKHSWGQNFLNDEGVLRKIAEAALLGPGVPCLELGPGLGHLTQELLKTGAKVTAVERDRDMAAILREEMPQLHLIEANAAQIDFAKTAGEPDITVVGNLPYHLTSPILFAVLDQHLTVKRAVFTLQKEVVVRLTANPGGRDFGILPVLLGLAFDLDLIVNVPRGLFHPPPKVDSAVVRLKRRAVPRAEVTDVLRFRRLVKCAFSQRRKTLSNSLKSDKNFAAAYDMNAALKTANIDPIRRAETLSVEEFAALERALGEVKIVPAIGASIDTDDE